MIRFIGHHLAPVIACLILASQLVAIATVRRTASPRLTRSWKARVLSVLANVLFLGLCAVPFYSTGAGVAILVLSLLMTASFMRGAWAVRAIGEVESVAIYGSALRRSSKAELAGSVLGNAACLGLVSAVMFVLSPHPSTWGYWVAAGMAYYAIISPLSQVISMYRIFVRSRPSVGSLGQ
jgi:hypothetical protein